MKKYLLLLIILLIAAINFNLFLKPLKLVTGGTQGVSIIINSFTNVSNSLIILIINVLMLILSFIFLRKQTTFGTILATISYPLFVKLTSCLKFNFDYYLLNVITTGIISGITNGLIYKLDFTAGGINVLAPIINKYKNIKVGTINLIINSLILLIGCLMFGIKNFLYAILVVIINSLLINVIMYKKTNQKSKLENKNVPN